MSIERVTAKINCVVWKNVQLPHPYKSLKSPIFCFDGFDWYFEVSCSLSPNPSVQNDCFINLSVSENKEEKWQFQMRGFKHSTSSISYNNNIKIYLETSGKYVAVPVQERISYGVSRSFLSSIFGFSGNDVITVLFFFSLDTLSIPLDFIETTIERLEENDTEKELKQKLVCLEGLSKDIGQLFNKDEHADVTLKCGETSFSVHRHILTARSEVFSAMFQHDMAEKNTGIVDIADLDSDILELFLRFLYTGKVEEMCIDTALELYQAAGRYSVNTLKQFCVSYILENLSKEIVHDVLHLADKAGDIEFLDAVASFAAKIEGFLKSTEWEEFAAKFPSVAVKVYAKYFK